MSTHKSIHDGWTPQPHVEEQEQPTPTAGEPVTPPPEWMTAFLDEIAQWGGVESAVYRSEMLAMLQKHAPPPAPSAVAKDRAEVALEAMREALDLIERLHSHANSLWLKADPLTPWPAETKLTDAISLLSQPAVAQTEAGKDITTAESFPSGWVAVTDELPPLELPIWLYLPEIGQPLIGSRCDEGDGWLWCRDYHSPWFDKKTREWHCGNAESDDLLPSHWMRLPQPPSQGLSESSPKSPSVPAVAGGGEDGARWRLVEPMVRRMDECITMANRNGDLISLADIAVEHRDEIKEACADVIDAAIAATKAKEEV